MPKCGIRGTATAKLAFHDMPSPHPNTRAARQGAEGRADRARFGRTTFGASCTGLARSASPPPRARRRRRQFGRPLADLELIKKKIAYLAATAYAMEATTYQTAALIDRGAKDYMLETAILKVFSTEGLWQGVYETLQVHGGQGYFSDEPYERMMRDARINTIGEGANEVLKAFIALVGMRDIGEGLKDPGGTEAPWHVPADLLELHARPSRPEGAHPVYRWPRPCSGPWPTRWPGGSPVRPDGRALLIAHREAILDRQYIQERIADAAIAWSPPRVHCRDGITRGHSGQHRLSDPRPSSTCEWPTAGSTTLGVSATTTTA